MTLSRTRLKLHRKQAIAFNSRANEILYGGAAGGGKSHLLRVRAIALAWAVPGIQIYIFRRLSDDLLRNHMEGAGGFYALLANAFANGDAVFNASKNFIRFRNGAKIWLCHCQYEKDVSKYQGAEFHVLMMDELTHFTDRQYRFLRSRCRLGTLAIPQELNGVLPLVLCGTNPGSSGHTWVKETFVDPHPPMTIWTTEEDEGGFNRQFIPAVLADNPSLDQAKYRATLAGLGRPELVKAMLEGEWDIVQGGALDDVWDKYNQVLPRFRIPASWRIKRCLDWGSSHPFSVGWYAIADGTEAVMPPRVKGESEWVFCPVRGSLIRFFEWYGRDPKKSNTGLKMSARAIAKNIITLEQGLRESHWIHKDVRIHAGPADNEIYAVKEKESGSIAKLMSKEGVLWCRSDKSSGSRKNGLQHVRDYLVNATNGEGVALYFTENCRHALSLLPTIPRDPKDPDDVDTKSEDHIYDEVRYAVLGEVSPATSGFPVTFTS